MGGGGREGVGHPIQSKELRNETDVHKRNPGHSQCNHEKCDYGNRDHDNNNNKEGFYSDVSDSYVNDIHKVGALGALQITLKTRARVRASTLTPDGGRNRHGCEEDSLEIVVEQCVLRAALKEDEESDSRSV